jgi:large subunit ribosomal protein L25
MHAVNLKQRLVVEVPIAYTGDSPAANSASRMLLTQLSTLSVECLPTNIPSSFQVDITHLNNEGDLVQVKQVTAPADVTILNDPEDVMIRVVLSRAGAREAAKGGAPTAAEAEDAVAEGETTDESTSSDHE